MLPIDVFREDYDEKTFSNFHGFSFNGNTFAWLFIKSKTTTYGHYEPQNEVRIIQSGQVIPEDVIRIGSVETGEKGMTPAKDCTYSACIDAIVKEAKKMGGNIVYIVSIKEPSVWGSTCYYVTADVYLQKSKE